MFRVGVGGYQLCCQAGGFPDMLARYREGAALAEDFGVDGGAGSSVCFLSVSRGQGWPFLVVTQHYSPFGPGFTPGALLVPETHRLFVGAGGRLLAYDLTRPARLWEDGAHVGFYSWGRHGNFVLMAAELELAAWDTDGCKLWTRYVEPPWEYAVEGEVVTVDVMGAVSRVDLRSGRPV